MIQLRVEVVLIHGATALMLFLLLLFVMRSFHIMQIVILTAFILLRPEIMFPVLSIIGIVVMELFHQHSIPGICIHKTEITMLV
jgi:hypothetical protein